MFRRCMRVPPLTFFSSSRHSTPSVALNCVSTQFGPDAAVQNLLASLFLVSLVVLHSSNGNHLVAFIKFHSFKRERNWDTCVIMEINQRTVSHLECKHPDLTIFDDTNNIARNKFSSFLIEPQRLGLDLKCILHPQHTLSLIQMEIHQKLMAGFLGKCSVKVVLKLSSISE